MDKTFSFLAVTMTILAVLIFIADYEEFKVDYATQCSEKEYLSDYEERKIYLYCINDIKVEDQTELYDFEEFIKTKGIEAVYKKANNRSIAKDNSSTTYYYNNFVIISCNNAIDDNFTNTDIVVGKRGITPSDACN